MSEVVVHRTADEEQDHLETESEQLDEQEPMFLDMESDDMAKNTPALFSLLDALVETMTKSWQSRPISKMQQCYLPPTISTTPVSTIV